MSNLARVFAAGALLALTSPASAGCINRIDGSRFCSDAIQGSTPPPPALRLPPLSRACIAVSAVGSGVREVRYTVKNNCADCADLDVVMSQCGGARLKSIRLGSLGQGTLVFDFNAYCGGSATTQIADVYSCQ